LRLNQSPDLVKALHLENLVSRAQSLIGEAVQHREKCKLSKNVSVFTSNYVGPCLVGALLYREEGAEPAAKEACSICFDKIVNCERYTTAPSSSDMPNELLYGRAGYLACLTLLVDAGYDVPVNFVRTVVERILSDGCRLSKEMQTNGTYQELIKPWTLRCPPLMFQWHDKAYLGAAHGFAGILMTLLKVCLPTEEWVPKKPIITRKSGRDGILLLVDDQSKLSFMHLTPVSPGIIRTYLHGVAVNVTVVVAYAQRCDPNGMHKVSFDEKSQNTPPELSYAWHLSIYTKKPSESSSCALLARMCSM
uniref:LanC-like protein 3 n=1 Tax=Schistocephalus solidus TaxID=70667 RepID=A0A183TPR3_SCHSO